MDKELKEEFSKINARLDQMIGSFATKEDLAGFATKKDLENFATKKDLDKKFEAVMTHFLTRAEFDQRFEDLMKYVDKKFDKALVIMDTMAKETLETRRNYALFEPRLVDVDDKVALHEKRIKALESKS